MAVKVSNYLPPGSYIEEEVVKPIPAFVGLPRQICVIGEGDPCKTVTNEDHIRAYIDEESVTPDTNGQFVLEKQSDLKKSTMALFLNGDEQVSEFTVEELIPIAPAAIYNATDAGLLDAGTHSYSTTFIINGTETKASFGSNIITALDSLHSADVGVPLGPTGTTARKLYRSTTGDPSPRLLVATIADNTTSIYNDAIADASLTTTEPSDPTGLSLVTIGADIFDPTGVYTFSYQSLAELNDLDILAFDVTGECGNILSIGSFRGTRNFVKNLDYVLDPGNNAVQWLPAAEAEITGNQIETFDFSAANLTLKLTIDGGVEQVVTFSNVDGEDFVSAAAATAAEVATKISTVLAGFVTAADNGSGQVTITTVSVGPDASLTIGAGTANTILGFQPGALAMGTGKNPAQGEEFFISYKAERTADEYNRPILSTSFDQFIQRVGNIASTNALALAGQIIFEQNPPFVYHIQVKNTGTGLAASDLDYIEAIRGAELNPDLTDIVVLGHPTTNAGGKKPLVRQALREHIIEESALQAKAERLGWFGMAIGTTIGDGETPGTFVYVATQELQVSADSPGRGRFVLSAPSFIKKTYRFPDGTAKQVTLDGTYLAAGVAALEDSFLSPAEGLLRKEVVGLDVVEELSVGDRDFMASNGVNVIQPRGGINVCFDPTTTDQSSAEFKEINVMSQKDNVVKRVRKATDDTLIGLVPDDLAQFIFELKSVVAVNLNAAIAEGAIAPFQNDDGTVRNIDLQNDIIVKRRANDPTAFDFRFSYFVKFIVKRLFGTFSVNIPSGV